MEVEIHDSRVVVEGECSASRYDRFNHDEIALGTRWIGWVGPRAGLDGVEIIF
jgi:hypothetical protein